MRKVKDQPGLWHLSHGGILNERDLKSFERAYKIDATCVSGQRVPVKEIWRLEHWGIALSPWPEMVPLDVVVQLEVGFVQQAEAPLFRIASPLDRTTDLERRLERLEAAFTADATGFRSHGSLRPCWVESGISWDVQLSGPGIDTLLKTTKTRVLTLAGVGRKLVG